MCDEYDDERMRAFWRALAEREEAEKLDPEVHRTESLDLPMIVPLGETVEPRNTKPKALVH